MRLYFLLFFSLIHAHNRSRIKFEDGNIYFHAEDGNITFRTGPNGGIYFNKTDVTKLPNKEDYDKFVRAVEKMEGVHNFLSIYNFGLKLENIQKDVNFITDHNKVITDEIVTLQQYFEQEIENQKISEHEILEFAETIDQITMKLEMNGCETNKCQNGGTCIPIHGTRFQCICPDTFTGQTCESDVNECEVENTELRCKNGGKCVNTVGGYECECKDSFYGKICELTSPTCTPSSSDRLCGRNGHCIQRFETEYDCVCDHGYHKPRDSKNPICVDINECERNPCHPGVQCVNVPGTFQCHGCPPGFKMEGGGCVDIDECQTHSHPCDHLVECRNLIGSYHCTSCPPGYSGEGKTKCVKDNVCSPNNCPDSATCVANDHYLNSHGYLCVCPHGFNAVTEENSTVVEDCVKSENAVCDSSPCFNGGTCNPFGDSYKCTCGKGYIGKNCEKASPCFSKNKCGHNGVCKVLDDDSHFCHCDHQFYGEKCEFQENMFDEHIRSLNGTYEFKLQSGSTKMIRNLYFDIFKEGSYLKMRFKKFEGFEMATSGAIDCTKTYANITIFDGHGDNYPPIGTFCGKNRDKKAPPSRWYISLTASSGLVRFEGLGGEYTVEYEVVTRSCGYRTTRSSGQLLVPDYNETVFCEWNIDAPATMLIEITVPPFKMSTQSCWINYLLIRDGITPVLERECESSNEMRTYLSKSPTMLVYFKYDRGRDFNATDRIDGFSMSYKFVKPNRPLCGGDIVNHEQRVGFSGVIRYPESDGFYSPNMACTWIIHPGGKDEDRRDLKTIITFNWLDIPSAFVEKSSTYCTTDYLKITDRYIEGIHVYCNGDSLTEKVELHSNSPKVEFHSDETIEGKGFEIQYEVVCEMKVFPFDSVQTFNFPHGGSAGTCTYYLENDDENREIMLLFKTIRFDVLSIDECFDSNDTSEYPNYVEIEQGDIGHKTSKKYFCQKDIFAENSTMYVNANTKITVVSDGNPNFRGLSFEVHSVDEECGGHFNGYAGLPESTSFSSPNYPEPYDPNKICKYTLTPKNHHPFIIHFQYFDIGFRNNNGTCEGDHLVLKSWRKEIIETFCGFVSPRDIKIDELTILEFISMADSNRTQLGFRAELLTLNLEKENYEKTSYNSSSGTVNVGSFRFRSVRERIEIVVEETRQIVLHLYIDVLHCNTSKVVVLDGIEEDSEVLLDGCGCDENYKNLFTTTNKATIIFTSIGKASLYATYSSLVKSCGGQIDGLAGAIATPQYPLRQLTSMECWWTVAVSKGNQIGISIEELDYNGANEIRGDKNCTLYGPGLMMFEKNELREEICAPRKAILFYSETNKLNLNYVQNNFISSRGFVAYFRTRCVDIEFTDPNGEIQSPGYTENIWADQLCHWRIIVPRGNRIELLIHDFSIPSNINCTEDFLTVIGLSQATLSNGTNLTIESKRKLRKFCDQLEPKHLYSEGNDIEIVYSSSKNSRFWLSWNTKGCLQFIQSPTNITVKKEHIHSDIFECQYKIQAPVGKKVQLKINKFPLQSDHDPCHYRSNDSSSFTGLAVFIGLSNSSGDPYYFTCEETENYLVETHSNEVFLFMSLKKDRFKSSAYIYLDATVEFVDQDENDTCGGIVNMNNNQKEYQITSPHYPSPYPDGTFCQWLFKAPEGRHIQYTLEEYQISSTQQAVENWDGDCNQFNAGYLNIYDSRKTDVEELDVTLCDNSSASIPMQIYANESLVEFVGAVVSSAANDTTGFVLKAKSVCGGVYYTSSKESTVYLKIDEPVCNVTFKNSNPKVDTVVSVQIEHLLEHVNMNVFKDRQFLEFSGNLEQIIYNVFYTVTAKTEVMFNFYDISKKVNVIMKYGSDEKKCGGNLMNKNGNIWQPEHDPQKPLHCIWTLDNTPGNNVALLVRHADLPISENCVDSYFEVEDYDQKKVHRFCHVDNKSPLMFEASKLTLTFRYLPGIDSPNFSIEFAKKRGGDTTSRTIRPPDLYENGDVIEWNIGTGNEEEVILVKIKDVYLSSLSYLGFSQYLDNGQDSTNENYDFKFNGAPSDQTFTLPYSKVLIRSLLHDMDDFTITWEPVPKNQPVGKDVTSNCGGVLQPDWTIKSISRPNLSNETDIHCIWTIYRPQFTNIELSFKTLNMGDSEDSCSEYVMIIRDDGEDESRNNAKYCHKELSRISSFSRLEYNKIEIHYFSTVGQHGDGFELTYTLNCYRHDFVSGSAVLTNPPIVNERVDCVWIVFPKNGKDLEIKFDALDIRCDDNNYLEMRNRKYCGTMNSTNPIRPIVSRMPTIIEYNVTSSNPIGFKLIIEEKQTECNDGLLRLDEKIPSTIIYSPDYPDNIPKSTECKYLIAVPNGHRVMLTFDEKNFEIYNQVKDEYGDHSQIDFIEVRDGISEMSSLIGNYSGYHAPSTIFSTGNALFMRLHTSRYGRSHRFIANVSIATCGGTHIIKEGEEVRIASPEKYNTISCQWNLLSYHSLFLLVTIKKIDCESLTILDGNSTLLDGPCDPKQYPLDVIRSASNQLKIIFDAQKKTSGFELIVKLSEIKCGGIISNDIGEITLPGYPDNILTRLECKWHFNAGMNFVYKLELQFTDQQNLKKIRCFFDLQIYNDITFNGEVMGGHRIFCAGNQSVKTTSMEFATLKYDDSRSRRESYQQSSNEAGVPPFVVKYTKIPAEGAGCSFIISENTTIRMGTSNYSRFEACHMKIKRPDPYRSVSLRSQNHAIPSQHHEHQHDCDSDFTPYTIISPGPILYNKKICGVTNESYVFINDEIDIYLQGFPSYRQPLPDIEFTIEFMECGGIIKDPNYGQIKSPNFGTGQKYLPNSKCLWLIEAPSDQKIKIKISSMNVEKSTNCEKDILTIGEGTEAEMNVLKTYCEEDINPSTNKNFEILSKSRHITIQWITDDNEEKSGWVIDYEFVNENNTCGYHTVGMSGVIKSPDNENSKYLNNQTCVWDIQVPSGYHINVTYDSFNVEDSTNCEKDRLTYSEVSNYVEVSTENSVEDQKVHCGHKDLKPHETGSSRMIFNFTTDASGNDKGFQISWKAVCGAMFYKNHGSFTLAKNLPGYPLTQVHCGYHIKAKPTEVVNFKIDKLKLSFIDNIGVMNGASKFMYEEKFDIDKHNFAVRGPVNILFWNSAFDGYQSSHPFFRVNYKIIQCGGEIHLSEEGELSFEIGNPEYLYPPKTGPVCNWNITTSADRYLAMEIMDNPQDQIECRSYFELFDGIDDDEYRIGKFCENETEYDNTPQTTGPHLLVKVVTGSDNKHRFKLSISARVTKQSGCGGGLAVTNSWKSIGPPRNSAGNYSRDLYCRWALFATMNQPIKIEANSMVDCENDELKLVDLLDTEMVWDICNKTNFQFYHDGAMGVLFKSSMGGSGVGFNLSYIHDEVACAHKLIANESVQVYNSSEFDHCEYDIHGKTNDPLLINMYTPETCESNQITTWMRGESECKHPACYDRSSTSVKCSSTFVAKVKSVKITLRLKASFDYQVLASCNRTIYIDKYPSSLLESSGHDFEKGECITKLEDSKGPENSKKLLIVFDDMRMGVENVDGACDQNYLQINAGDQVVSKLCNTAKPLPILTNGSTDVTVTFNTDFMNIDSYQATYFSVELETEDKIQFASINTSRGIVASYGGFTKAMEQIFIISPPDSKECTFTISRSKISNCEEDAEYLKIYEIFTDDQTHETNFCRTNVKLINFKKIQEGRYFRINYKSQYHPITDNVGFELKWACNEPVKEEPERSAFIRFGK